MKAKRPPEPELVTTMEHNSKSNLQLAIAIRGHPETNENCVRLQTTAAARVILHLLQSIGAFQALYLSRACITGITKVRAGQDQPLFGQRWVLQGSDYDHFALPVALQLSSI